MSQPNSTGDLYCVLPYLRTHERVVLRGVVFQPSNNLANLPPTAQEHLTTLVQMFYLPSGTPVTNPICAFIPEPKDDASLREAENKLRQAHHFITYLYTAPHPSGGTFLHAENCSLFVFLWKEKSVPPSLLLGSPGEESTLDQGKLADGFHGWRNWRTRMWVHKGSTISPEVPQVVENVSQDLFFNAQEFLSDHRNWALAEFYQGGDGTVPREIRQRVSVAMDWYLNSCRSDVSGAEAILYLSIALESLLKLEPGKDLTERFMLAVHTLLGPVDRLEWWLRQFYNAHSKTVHEGAPATLAFLPVEKVSATGKDAQPPVPHRTLVEYGHRVFRLCLTTMISSAVHVHSVGLASLFIPNRERLERICKTMKDTTVPAELRFQLIGGDIRDLSQCATSVFDFEAAVKVDTVIAAGKHLLSAFKETSPQLDPSLETLLGDILTDKTKTPFGVLSGFEALAKRLVNNTGQSSVAATVVTFLEYASGHSFMLRSARPEDFSPKE